MHLGVPVVPGVGVVLGIAVDIVDKHVVVVVVVP